MNQFKQTLIRLAIATAFMLTVAGSAEAHALDTVLDVVDCVRDGHPAC